MREEAISLFQTLDFDQDGIINKEELLHGFPQIDEETADLLITEVDSDQDSSINFDELWNMIQSVASSTSSLQAHGQMTNCAPVLDTQATGEVQGSREASVVQQLDAKDENQSGDEGKKTQGAATNKEPQNESRREVANSLPAVTAVKGSACCVIF